MKGGWWEEGRMGRRVGRGRGRGREEGGKREGEEGEGTGREREEGGRGGRGRRGKKEGEGRRREREEEGCWSCWDKTAGYIIHILRSLPYTELQWESKASFHWSSHISVSLLQPKKQCKESSKSSLSNTWTNEKCIVNNPLHHACSVVLLSTYEMSAKESIYITVRCLTRHCQEHPTQCVCVWC